MAWRFEDGTYVEINGCTNPPFSSVNYPDIPITTANLSYTIPSGICGSGAGLVDFYVSGMIDLAAPCMDLIYTMPSELPLSVSCLNAPEIYTSTATSCAGDSTGNIVYEGSTFPNMITGGTPPYFFDWMPSPPLEMISILMMEPLDFLA